MNLYFDNAAAMQVSASTAERFAGLMRSLYPNQESPVSGMKPAITQASEAIRKALCGSAADDYDVLFVNTGTDAVSAAFLAVEKLFHGGSIALSGGEHASVRAAAMRLGKDFSRHVISCDRNGFIGESDYAQAITPDTMLAAVHVVQPETGCIQNLMPLRKILSERAPNALFFADAIQSAGKVPFDFSAVKPDMMSISGQKLGVPGGAALIYRKKFKPLFQKLRFEEHRIGRLPPVFAVLLGEAVTQWTTHFEKRRDHAAALRELLLSELDRLIPGKYRRTVSDPAKASPYITHLLLDKGDIVYQGAIVTRALSERGILAAPGSACDAETTEPSTTLTWMGIPKQSAYSALRISISPENDADGVRALAAALAEIIRQY